MKTKIKYRINKKYNMKKREIKFYYRSRTRGIQFRDLVISYVELENRLKVMEEKVKSTDTEINYYFRQQILFRSTEKNLCYKRNRCLSYR